MWTDGHVNKCLTKMSLLKDDSVRSAGGEETVKG